MSSLLKKEHKNFLTKNHKSPHYDKKRWAKTYKKGDSSPKSARLNNLSNDDMLPENRLNRDPPLPWREGIKGRGKLIPYSPPPQPSPINGEGDLVWLWSSSTFPMNTKELIF
jgi:hypothetical protein